MKTTEFKHPDFLKKDLIVNLYYCKERTFDYLMCYDLIIKKLKDNFNDLDSDDLETINNLQSEIENSHDTISSLLLNLHYSFDDFIKSYFEYCSTLKILNNETKKI